MQTLVNKLVILKKTLRSLEHKRLYQNIQNLFLYQGINYVFPLITVPYIMRIVGPEKFGILSLAEVVTNYFILITDYGFNITATQKISIHRDNAEERSLIFWSVFWIKLILMGCCFILLIGITAFSASSKQIASVYLFYFLMVPGNMLLAYWFYLGVEAVHALHYPNLVAKLGYTVSVLCFLKESSDFYLVPLFQGGFLILGGVLSSVIVFRKFRVIWRVPTWRNIKDTFKEGREIFLSTFAINLYRRSNVLILGFFGSEKIVGFYSAGEKIIHVLQSIFLPIIKGFYPFIARQKQQSSQDSIKSIQFLIKWIGLGTALTALGLMFFAEPLIRIVAKGEFLSAVPVLKIGSFVLCFSSLNYIIGIIFMTNFNMKKAFVKSVIITGVSNVLLCSVLSFYWLEIGAAISFLSAEALLLVLLTGNVFRKQKHWREVCAPG